MNKNGGSAFPVTDARYGYDGEYLGLECTDTGMTLRDWFAGQALAGLSCIPSAEGNDRSTAVRAYHLADAMLAKREKNNTAEIIKQHHYTPAENEKREKQ